MNTNLNNVYIADAYYRLSKEDGDKIESDSIINQKALVKEFLKAHPDIHIYEEKVDDGYTGVNFERPAFQNMLEDIRSGKVNCVIVKDLSRFGRNYIEAGRYIEKIFPYLGVRFIAVNDNIDTSSSMSASEEMLIPFKNLINDAYCRDISIKVRSHLDIKRKNGQYIGPFAPYGYKKSPTDKNKLVIDEKAASVVRQIFRWKLEGMSASRIFDLVSETFAIDTRVSPEEQTLYLFSGFVKCGQCGGNMTRKTVPVNGKKYVYLVCMENKNKSGCKNNRGISLKKFQKVILRVINLHIEKIFELSQMLQVVQKIPYNGYISEKLRDIIVDKEDEIRKKQHYSAEIYGDYKESIISRKEYLELKEIFQEEITALQDEIQALREEMEKLARDRKDKVQWVQQFIEYRGFTKLSRDLLLRLVKEIRIYDKDRIEVVFKFQAEYEELCGYIADMRENREGGHIDGKEKPKEY